MFFCGLLNFLASSKVVREARRYHPSYRNTQAGSGACHHTKRYAMVASPEPCNASIRIVFSLLVPLILCCTQSYVAAIGCFFQRILASMSVERLAQRYSNNNNWYMRYQVFLCFFVCVFVVTRAFVPRLRSPLNNIEPVSFFCTFPRRHRGIS